MAYYKNNRNNFKNHNQKRNNHRPHHGQSYVWVVYNLREARNHTFTSKVQALQYYYNHEFQCFSPEKKDH